MSRNYLTVYFLFMKLFCKYCSISLCICYSSPLYLPSNFFEISLLNSVLNTSFLRFALSAPTKRRGCATFCFIKDSVTKWCGAWFLNASWGNKWIWSWHVFVTSHCSILSLTGYLFKLWFNSINWTLSWALHTRYRNSCNIKLQSSISFRTDRLSSTFISVPT